ncbi:MAG TPA: MerR family transcriptional regulator [Ktedonobacteraceae bacterium]
MQENDIAHFSIEELAEQVDTSVRTVRYYITEGLLPGPQGRGKATTYGDEHLQRLRLIRLLSNQHRPLAEIHQLLDRLSLAEIRTLLVEEEQRAKELEPEDHPQLPRAYIATLLKNAQATRLSLSSQAPAVAQPLPAGLRIQERLQTYGNPPAPVAETWQRLELAPGIELHIRGDAAERQRALLESIYKAAGMPFQEFHK